MHHNFGDGDGDDDDDCFTTQSHNIFSQCISIFLEFHQKKTKQSPLIKRVATTYDNHRVLLRPAILPAAAATAAAAVGGGGGVADLSPICGQVERVVCQSTLKACDEPSILRTSAENW